MTLGGVVLAGGRSSRMGAAKADLDWHGVPLVVHVARAVAAATRGPVVVVGAPGQELPAELTVARDPVAGRGPLQGLAVGLAALGSERAFVCATDQPRAHEVLPALLAVRAADVVSYAGQPLGALYRTGLAALATRRLDADASLRGLLRAVDTVELDGPVPAALRSLDTPEDYAEALSRS
jgi:molybdopterin-guanine dinucleotide biosynthesis protein A